MEQTQNQSMGVYDIIDANTPITPVLNRAQRRAQEKRSLEYLTKSKSQLLAEINSLRGIVYELVLNPDSPTSQEVKRAIAIHNQL